MCFIMLAACSIDVMREEREWIGSCERPEGPARVAFSEETTSGRRFVIEKTADRVTIAVLVESGLVQAGDRWVIPRRRSGEAQDVEGEVTGDGNLRVGDQEFRSVSEAVRQALGTDTNGWKRWSCFNVRVGSTLISSGVPTKSASREPRVRTLS